MNGCFQANMESAARFFAASRRREILEVDDQRVGAAVRHRVVRERVGAGAEEPGASQIGVSQVHQLLLEIWLVDD